MPNARSNAYAGKHRRQAHRLPVSHLVAAAAAGAVLATGVLVGAAEAATNSDFARLRMCESGGNYGINTGNGYYGAYQFDLQTWHGLGLSGRPDQASRSAQDAAARLLQSQRGWGPWPVCSRNLGLRAFAPTASRSSRRAPLATFHANASFRPVPAPEFPGARLSAALVGSVRADVRAWQAQMAHRGWLITVDGRYGPKTAAVAHNFERQQHINGAGVVGVVAWRLAWEAPAAR